MKRSDDKISIAPDKRTIAPPGSDPKLESSWEDEANKKHRRRRTISSSSSSGMEEDGQRRVRIEEKRRSKMEEQYELAIRALTPVIREHVKKYKSASPEKRRIKYENLKFAVEKAVLPNPEKWGEEVEKWKNEISRSRSPPLGRREKDDEKPREPTEVTKPLTMTDTTVTKPKTTTTVTKIPAYISPTFLPRKKPEYDSYWNNFDAT